MGGRMEPVRRKRYEQWKPNRVVYDSWTSVVIAARLAALALRPYRLNVSHAWWTCAVGRTFRRERRVGRQAYIPMPNASGPRKIMRFVEAPDRWYTASTQDLKTTSSVMGA